VIIKAGLAYAPPLSFAALRLLLGGAALLALLLFLRQPLLPALGSWPWLVALALSAATFSYGAMFVSQGFTSAGIASVLGNTQPLIIVVLAAAFLGERMTRGKWLALLLGFGGATLIATPVLAVPDAYGLDGALLALGSAGGLAVGSVLIKRMGPGTNLLIISAWQLLLGSLPLLGAAALLERGTSVRWTAEFAGMLLILALAGTAFVVAAWYWLIQSGDLGRLSMFFFLVPAFGLVLAGLFSGERIGPIQWLGLALVVGGLAALAPEVLRSRGTPGTGRRRSG
jgi:drug/metabolite transporter (DMT)-like permease